MIPSVKLPRTGIEQVFCGDRPRFIEAHREFERIASVNVSQTSLSFERRFAKKMNESSLYYFSLLEKRRLL